ncbi:hypothetical protein GJV52_07105 [Neisseria brasiliensis]|uniref:hypothetical protein n=1 Tax=Neisseria TaxID=482 RepID=UPI000C270848|nr:MULTISPECIES: hypothetical protein [Neisseria]PJO77129.1 hypothetical protein CWC45_12060 [Neisseria sp. N177_16]QGL25319.1 hypothetical protein GJV52_07105 [Neisseria brasiliensis]
MVWREYYTLEEAAHVLSQKLKAVYTIADLTHYGALGIVEYCVPVPNIRFFKRSLAELYYLPDNTRRPLIIQKVLYSAPFAPIPNILMQEIEIYGSAKLTACPHLIDYSGGEISAALVGLEDLGIHKSFNNFELKIPRQSINGKLRVGVRTVQCNSVQDVIDAQRHHKKIDGVLSGIKNFKNDGWFYQFIPETAIYDFLTSFPP